ncbi:MAG: RidA family protein [Armatimonadetes bacterium]|nr:RidA family protein [Armatimonadota bacterium]
MILAGLELPPAPKPSGLYRPVILTGLTVWTSGHAPARVDGSRYAGRIGETLSVEEGKEAARLCALGILSSLREALRTLDRVQRVVRVFGAVNAVPEFTQHPAVLDGCSEVFSTVFGEAAGTSVRSAVGVSSLPGNAPCQIEAVFLLNEAQSD